MDVCVYLCTCIHCVSMCVSISVHTVCQCVCVCVCVCWGGHVGSNYKVLLLTNERRGGECRGEDGEVDLYAVGSQL